MRFHDSNGHPMKEIGTRIMGYCCDRPEHIVFGRIVVRSLELWATKALECLELSGLFFRGSEDENVKSNADNGGLACEILEEVQTLPGLLCEESVVSGQLELKNQL